MFRCPEGQESGGPTLMQTLTSRVPAGGGSRGRDQGGADAEAPDVSSRGEGRARDGRGLRAVFGICFWESLLFG